MRIAVVRALPGLGDLLCTVPALRSVRAGAPRAEVTMVGLPAGGWFASRFNHLVDRWIDLPWWPSITEAIGDPADTVSLLASTDVPFDLVLQMQGSGGPVNRLAALLAGGGTAAVHESAAAAHCEVPPVTVEEGRRCGTYVQRRWPDTGHEIERLCGLAQAVGFPDCGTALEWPSRPGEEAAAAGLPPRYAVVHPGASLPERRWDIAGFAATVTALAETGLPVVLTGSWAESDIVREVARSSGTRPVLLTDLLLAQLAGVVSRAAVTVVNDTGVAHLSVAVGTPTVVIGTTSDLARWAPLDRQQHAAHQTTGDTEADVEAVVGAAVTICR